MNPLAPLLGLCTAQLLAGCVTVSMSNDTGRHIFVFGFARVTVPALSSPRGDATAYQISGLGVSLGRLVQIGYFREFEIQLRPGSDAAVIIVRTPEQLERLRHLLAELNQENLCIVVQPVP